MADKDPLQHLTIFLAVAGKTENDLIRSVTDLNRTEVLTSNGQHLGSLFTRPSKITPPRWVDFFRGAVDPAVLGLTSSSAAGALLVPVSGRHALVTFGGGRHLVNTENTESAFGLKVTLNCVDESKIRSIDRSTFEGITTHVREQSSKESKLSDFGLSVDRDVLRAVVGTPREPGDGNRLAGMDALHTTVRVTMEHLPALLENYVRRFMDTDYQTRFSWVDNVREIRSKPKIDLLDATLMAQIRAGDLIRKWLAVPDIIDWQDVGGFRYTRKKTEPLVHDLSFESLLETVENPRELDVAFMKRRRVVLHSATSDHVLREWPLYRCIYAEIDEGGDTCLLNDGRWFTLKRTFVERLSTDLRNIHPTSERLPDCFETDEEAHYNQRLTSAVANALCMDKKLVYYGGGYSRIEFCDVFADKRVLHHVKLYSGSAVLSHLFAQGRVAATLFVSDADFRKTLNNVLPPSHRLRNPTSQPRAQDYEVSFVIAGPQSRPEQLPVFSRITLRDTYKALSGYGYRVSLIFDSTLGEDIQRE